MTTLDDIIAKVKIAPDDVRRQYEEYRGRDKRAWIPNSGPQRQACQSEADELLFTDGIVGPQPHEIAGIGPCDINSYDHGAEQLIAEWASGIVEPAAPVVSEPAVNVLIEAPPMVKVRVRVMGTVTADYARLRK